MIISRMNAQTLLEAILKAMSQIMQLYKLWQQTQNHAIPMILLVTWKIQNIQTYDR